MATEGTVGLGYITIDLDGEFTGSQVMDVTDFDVHGNAYASSNGAATTPEPELSCWPGSA